MTVDPATQPAEPRKPIDLVGRQVSVSLLASLGGIGLRYACAIFTTRILGVALFGTYVQAQAIVRILSLTSTMGLSPGVVPFVAKQRLAGDEAGLRAVVRATWKVAVVAAAVAAFGLLVLAPWLASGVFRDEPLDPMLTWLLPFVVFEALSLATLALVQGFKAVRVQAVIGRLVTVGATLAGLVVTWVFGLGVEGVLVATMLGPLSGFVGAALYVSKRVPGLVSGPAAAPPTRELLATCWPLMGSTVLNFALASIDVMILGVMRESSEVGIYGAAARLLPAVFFIHQSGAGVFYAHATERHVAGDRAEVERLYKRVSRWSMWSGLGIITLLVVWGRQLLGLYGPEFAAGGAVLALLALGKGATTLTGLCGKALIATGFLRLNMINQVVFISLKVGLSVLWIPEHGALGAATATLVSSAVVRLGTVTEVWVLLRMHPWTRDSLVAVVAAALVCVLVRPVSDGFGGALGWVPFAVLFALGWLVLFATVGAGEEERATIRSLVRRGRRG